MIQVINCIVRMFIICMNEQRGFRGEKDGVVFDQGD